MKKTIVLYGFFMMLLKAEKIPFYIGSGSNEGISYALLDSESGELGGLKNAVQTNGPGSLVLSGDKKFVFATGKNKGEKTGFVASFYREADDALRLVNSQSSMGSGPCHISMNGDSTVLLVANYSSGSVASYKVGEKGVISSAVSEHQHEGSSVNPKRQKGPHAHSIYASRDGKFVYSADLGTDKVMIYKLDETSGELISGGNVEVPAGGGPRHMAFSSDGEKLYVLNELTLTVSQFARDAESGGLKLEVTKAVMAEAEALQGGMTCSEIQVSEDGKFIYVACRDLKNKKRDVISVLKREDLSIIQEQATGAWIPRHFGISPSGKWLLIAGQKENKVVVHSRDTVSGVLTKTSHSIDLEKPMWILFP